MAFFHRILRGTAIGVFVVYLAWNVLWLFQGTSPPSLFLALTGWPSPTTGGTRSLQHLLAGQWSESLRYNAMTVPLVLLLTASGLRLGGQLIRKQRLSLPAWLAWSWAAVLVIAWALKLCGDPGYW
jgi:hypothetical protein